LNDSKRCKQVRLRVRGVARAQWIESTAAHAGHFVFIHGATSPQKSQQLVVDGIYRRYGPRDRARVGKKKQGQRRRRLSVAAI
jgi:hypothetical protein